MLEWPLTLPASAGGFRQDALRIAGFLLPRDSHAVCLCLGVHVSVLFVFSTRCIIYKGEKEVNSISDVTESGKRCLAISVYISQTKRNSMLNKPASLIAVFCWTVFRNVERFLYRVLSAVSLDAVCKLIQKYVWVFTSLLNNFSGLLSYLKDPSMFSKIGPWVTKDQNSRYFLSSCLRCSLKIQTLSLT